MIPITIDDARDPRLADYVGVREPHHLRQRGLVLIEGRFVVRRLLGAGRIRFRSLLVSDTVFRGLGNDLDGLDPTVEVYLAPADVVSGITGFNLHRGCLAIGERPAELTMEAMLRSSEVVVALERVVDADNVGSVFRNAEAFGADLVLLSPGCCDPLYRKAIRTSSGASLMVPFASASPWPRALDQLRAAGFTIAALTPDAQAIEIGLFVATAAARGRIAVVLGTEGEGLTPDVLSTADVRVRIPMDAPRTGRPNGPDSLNIATAAGIALHRLHEARTQARDT